jgi:hypothetical protein
LNLDPFWAAVVAYLVAGKKMPTSWAPFAFCLVVAVAGAMLLAFSQTKDQSMSLQMFSSDSLVATALALPVPVLWALSGSLVGKWFSNFDEAACIAVTFTTAAVVVVPIALAIALARSGFDLSFHLMPAIALLTLGTILSTGFGRVVYQKALTMTDNNNGFVSMFLLLIPAVTCLISLGMSPWIKELSFTVSPVFFVGMVLIAAPILIYSWQSLRAKAEPESRALVPGELGADPVS